MNTEKKEISLEEVGKFLEGRDPQERIVNLLYSYQDNFITVLYRNENDQKCESKEQFFPFVWATRNACNKLAECGRDILKALMNKYGIGVKKLSNTNVNGETITDFEDGYMFLFYARNPMSYTKFLAFFKEAGNPVYGKDKDSDNSRQYLAIPPQEQYLIQTGKRFFKGYDDYDQLLRMIFDLETEGLDPTRHRIKLNGVKLNRSVTIKGKEYKNWGKIFRLEGETEEEKDKSELEIIDTMLKLIYTFKPDVITAHNGENFDWNFIITRCEMLGTSMQAMSSKYFNGDYIRKEDKPSILKLGGEMEEFYRTIVPNTTVTDSMHAVRRAQATDSNFLRADLKYSTKYLKLKKDNRVYVTGSEIDNTLIDTEHQYAFNNTDGDWYIIDENGSDASVPFKKGKDGDKPFVIYKRNYLADGYEITTGKYIVERYLLDDLWECDKVEYTLNGTDFMLTKMIPLPYSKCATMGTAGQWKAIMLAWSYENNLAVPMAPNTGAFTGGLSRLLNVGYVDNVVKLDYNSLYPSIILTWGISDDNDLMNAMLHMLEYVLTTREKYKGLKKSAGKIVDKYKERINNGETLTTEEEKEYEIAQKDYKTNDNRQMVVKKLGNSFFGSYGSNNGAVFPWKSTKCAEQTTCTGRQSLRLMISHFHNLGYKPIVGDSVTGDTPLFIKYNDTGYIDIKPIEEIFTEDLKQIDELGREYDCSEKNYKVLCRNGWQDIEYVYRHEVTKDIYEITDGKSIVECTEDHSLFDKNRNEIKPSDINTKTELEYYTNKIDYNELSVNFSEDVIIEMAKQLANGVIDRVPYPILNGSKNVKNIFYKEFIRLYNLNIEYSKTCVAGIQFLSKK